jgi:mannosyl-oligosaccharide glucosidase
MRVWLLSTFALSAYVQAKDDAYFWGPYRPNLYFGLRPRLPQSLMTGLLWFSTADYKSVSRIRHACEQGDDLQGYTWTEYDPSSGGVQVISDPLNNVKITTEFLKVPGGDHGGSWASRIKGEPLDKTKPSRVSVIFYAGLEGLGGLDMETDEDENGLEGDVILKGSTPELDDFTIRIVDDLENNPITTGSLSAQFADRIGKTHFLGSHLASGKVWTARETILQNIITRASGILKEYQDPSSFVPDPAFVLQLSDETYSGSNMYAVQKSFDGAFQFDILYENADSKQKLTSSVLDQGIQSLKQSYDQRFKTVFPVPQDYPTDDISALEAFSKAITSNLVAGVGYFYGNSIVDPSFSYEWDDETQADELEGNGARLTDPIYDIQRRLYPPNHSFSFSWTLMRSSRPCRRKEAKSSVTMVTTSSSSSLALYSPL